MFVAFQSNALNEQMLFDSQRPDKMSNENWLSLQSALEYKNVLSPASTILKWNETKLSYSVAAADDAFGVSVSASSEGNRVLIGVNRDDGNNGEDSGSAYIYDLVDGKWIATKLTASDGAAGQFFGNWVSLFNDRALIGSNGAAYIFDLINDSWVETKLSTIDGGINGSFVSVSLSLDKALVGASNHPNGTGAVYIFELFNGNWVETKLIASNGALGDGFGHSVSLVESRALVGANNGGGGLFGAAYIYDLIGNEWIETILPVDFPRPREFGFSVSLSGDRCLVGARGSGSAHIYDLIDSNWVETKLIPSDLGFMNNSLFGETVSLVGNRALIGSRFNNENGNHSGAVYIYDLINDNWIETKINASDGNSEDQFGVSVSLSGNKALIGTFGGDDDGNNSGSVYLMELIPMIFSDSFE